MVRQDIWLIGTGLMAREYAKVLKALDCKFTAIGRNEINCKLFQQETGIVPFSGGLESFLQTSPAPPEAVIVAVGIESLQATTRLLLLSGIKYILLEKPGVGYANEIHDLASESRSTKATVLIAYNRRFYSSVLKARELVKEDGGVTSFTFEFTEWSHVVSNLKKHKAEHHNWFLGNSTHVIDTAFFLGGKPKTINAFYKGGTEWHPTSSIFVGAGESELGALFSYHANWEAPGRWWLDVLTPKRRLIFKPFETLQCQELGSVAINPVTIDDELDKIFKPGIYRQTVSFLKNEIDDFPDIYEQQFMISNVYSKMSGYDT